METNFNNLNVDKDGRVSFSGLGSGIDFQSTVDAIIKAKRIPVDRIEKSITDNEAKIAAFDDLKALFDTLETSLDSLRGKIAFGNVGDIYENKQAFATTSVSGNSLFRPSGALQASEALNIVGVTVTNAAQTGDRTIEVINTAKAHSISSVAVASQSTPLNLTGDFYVNGGKIQISAGQSLNDVRDAINNATFDDDNDPTTAPVSIKVSAKIVAVSPTENFLIMTNDDTGTTMTIQDPANILFSLGVVGKTGAVLTGTPQADPNAALGLSGTITIGQPDGSNVTDTRAVTPSMSLNDMDALLDVAGVNYFVTPANELQLQNVSGFGHIPIGDPDGILASLGIQTNNTNILDELQTPESAQYTLDGISDPNRYQSELIYSAAATIQTLTSGTVADGTFDVTIGGTTNTIAYTVAVDDTNSLVSKINTAFGSTVASVDNFGIAGIRLVIDGGGSAVTIDNDSNGPIGLVPAFNFDNPRILTSTSNTINDNGMTFTLFQEEPGTTVNISVEQDLNAVKTGVTDFVDAYNAIMQFIKDQGTPPTTEAGLKNTVRGPLFQDSTVRDLQLALSSTLTESVAGVSKEFSALGSIGIDIIEDGFLQVDEQKLDDMLLNNPDDFEKFFAFNATTNNANFQVLGFDGDMKVPVSGLNIDFTADASGNILTATVGGSSADIQISGGRITFTGGDNEGLILSYNGGAVAVPQTMTVNYSVGLAAKLFEDVGRILLVNTGKIDQEVDTLTTVNENSQSRADQLLERLDRERARLLEQFLRMEVALSSFESTKQSITQSFNALNNSQN